MTDFPANCQILSIISTSERIVIIITMLSLKVNFMKLGKIL